MLMKQLRLLFTIFLLATSAIAGFAQAQDDYEYTPLVEQGKTWWYKIQGKTIFDWGNEFNGGNIGCFSLSLNGEWEVEGNKWSGLYLNYNDITSPFPIALLREEDREVYLQSENIILSEEEKKEMKVYRQDLPHCLLEVLNNFQYYENLEGMPDGMKILSFKKNANYLYLNRPDYPWILGDVLFSSMEGDEGKEYVVPTYRYDVNCSKLPWSSEEYDELTDRDEDFFRDSAIFSIYKEENPYNLSEYNPLFNEGYGKFSMLLLEGIGLTHITFYSTTLFWELNRICANDGPFSYLLYVSDREGNTLWSIKNGKSIYENIHSGAETVESDNISLEISRDIAKINTSGQSGIFSISNIAGQQIYEKRIEGKTETVISIDGLTKGVYIARLDINGKTITRKFVR